MPITDLRDIYIQICKEIEAIDVFEAKGLKYEEEIYIAPGITWMETGAPLEIQVTDAGEITIDRDGSVRRGQLDVSIGIMFRRPAQFSGKHSTILSSLEADIQSYARAIRQHLDGNFLEATLIYGEDAEELLVRPLVYTTASGFRTEQKYPDLIVKELRFTGGINDELA